MDEIITVYPDNRKFVVLEKVKLEVTQSYLKGKMWLRPTDPNDQHIRIVREIADVVWEDIPTEPKKKSHKSKKSTDEPTEKTDTTS